MISYMATTKKGKKRRYNQDCICVDRKMINEGVCSGNRVDNSLLAVICDGVSGEAGGDYAAREVAASFLWLQQEKVGLEQIVQHVRKVNDILRKKQREYQGYGKMSTTLAGISIVGDYAICFNLGDSRIYRMKEGHLEQVSTDHTLAQKKQETTDGTITLQVCEQDKNILTKYMGGVGERRNPSIRVWKLGQQNATFIVCSDGVYKNISEKTLKKIVKNKGLLKSEMTHIMKEIENSDDDASVILVQYEAEKGEQQH